MKKKNEGFILILVLGFSLSFVFITILFNYETQKYLNTLTQLYENFEMDRIGEIGFEIAKKILEKDKTDYDWLKEKWAFERNFNIMNYDLKILIKDEDSKININKIIEEKGKINESLLNILKNLFVICDYPSSLIDCLLDWIDEDNIERISGAENFYYSSIGFKNLPPNRNIKSLREFYLIKGFDEKILSGDEEKKDKGLLNFITIYSDGKININTCEREIINSMGFTNEQVDLILKERENRPLNESFLVKINREVFLKNKILIKYSSSYFHISIKVRNEKGDEKNYEGILKKDKNLELIRKGIL
ncbi:MAG: general secretion pathway protein GspK [Candidatus Ratteibacteria bacterium]